MKLLEYIKKINDFQNILYYWEDESDYYLLFEERNLNLVYLTSLKV